MTGRRRKTADEPLELTEKQKAQIRELLLAEERRILTNAEKGLELAKTKGDVEGGRDSIDISTDEELLSTELRLRDREKKLLNKVRMALARLEEGTINVCEDCGGPIGFKRLLVRPVTTLCIQCKEAREAEERLMESAGKSSADLAVGISGPDETM